MTTIENKLEPTIEINNRSTDKNKPLSNEEKLILEIEEQLDRIAILEEYYWNSWKILNSKLKKEDYQDPEATDTIDLLEKYRSQYLKALEEWNILKQELEKFKNEFNKIEHELNPSIWELELNEKEVKSLSIKDFLNIEYSNRLKYISKDNIETEKILSWEIKIVEFDFGKNKYWIDNNELVRSVSMWVVMPENVREVKSNGIIYSRLGLNWEFFSSEGVRLKIYTWTEIEISKLWEEKDLSIIREETLKNKQNFIKENQNYNKSEYKDIISICIDKWLNFKEIEIILSWNISELSKFNYNEIEKLTTSIELLDNLELLDNHYIESDILNNIKDLKDFLNKYWKWIHYKISENWNVEFSSDGSLPENLDIEASLKNFIDIAKSQVGINENSWGADKYLSENWKMDAKKIPWCTAFINWSLEKAWYKWTWSALAKSFIGGEWTWHVWIKLWDKMIWWNQNNKVSIKNINEPIIWWVLPKDVWNPEETHKNRVFDKNTIPNWAIIVFDRHVSNKAYS